MDLSVEIAVLPYGNVIIGQMEDNFGEPWIIFHNAKTIRRWGTSRSENGGLGLLAYEGPQPETVLDKEPMTRVPRGGVIKLIQVTPEAAEKFGYSA